MKKNNFMRIATVLMVVTLLSTCVISGTFAKYTSSTKGSTTATVAKWSILVQGNEENANEIAVEGSTPTVSFDMLETRTDSDGSVETDVVAGKIAPGTMGSFSLKVENKSEVTAKIAFNLSGPTNNNIPLEFRATTDGVNFSEWNSSLPTLQNGMATTLGIPGVDGAEPSAKTVTVQWRWAFSVNGEGDAADTSLGIDARTGTNVPTYPLNLTLNATQVD